MRVRIETVGPGQPEEVVVYCQAITPEVEALVGRLKEQGTAYLPSGFFKGDEQFFLAIQEVLFFEVDNERVFAHTADDSFEVKARLYEIEAGLPSPFVRVSRSAIVNTLQVRSIQKGLTGVSHIAFRNSRKEIYGSRLYLPLLSKKMEERSIYDYK